MKNLKMVKYKDSIYGNVFDVKDEDVIYCELRYQRDRSSFAGIALKKNKQIKDIVIRECSEIMIKEESKYEKIYIGCDEDYVNSIKETLTQKEHIFGIEIYFLVYSDIRSSKMIFKELMKEVIGNIDRLSNLEEYN